MSLEKDKKELELKRVLLGRDEMLYKIKEKEFELQRLKDGVKIQEDAISKIEKEIREMEK